MAGHGHQLKNEDGTVNLAGIQGHVKDLKAKYAQNAANYERNTGHPMNLNSNSEATTNAGAQGHGEVGQTRGDADHDGPEGFADAAQPKGDSGQTRESQPGGGRIGGEGHGSQV